MAFTPEEISADLAGLPPQAFAVDDSAAREAFAAFVCAVDENAKAKHDVRFYTATARAMAEVVQGVNTDDFADEMIRDILRAGMQPNSKPFQESGPDGWKPIVLTPAMLTLAMRAQRKCQAMHQQHVHGPGPSAPGAPPEDFSKVAGALKQFAEAQTAALQKNQPKGLSFVLQERIKELGLEGFPKDAMPSEEVLARFEASGKFARDRGRPWVGSAEGEGLQEHHRPRWSRAPVVDTVVGSEGSFEDRVKQVLDAKKTRSWTEKIDYPGFACFLGHLMEWGMKVVLTKACTMLDLHGYIFNLTKISEEHGGVRTAFQYDIMARTEMAKALERGETDLHRYLADIDKDMVKEAKEKIKSKYSEVGHALKGHSKGGKGSWQTSGGSSGSAGPRTPKGAGKGAKPDKRKVKTPPRTRSRSRARADTGNQQWQWDNSKYKVWGTKKK